MNKTNTIWEVEALVGYKKLTDKDWWEEKQEYYRLRNRDKSMYGVHIIGEHQTGTFWLYNVILKAASVIK
jgi:hypothetical protein